MTSLEQTRSGLDPVVSALQRVSLGNLEEAAGRRQLPISLHACLRSMILRGELPAGSVLPQAKVARILGVSRTPLREAFRLLQEEGLIDVRPDQRARVRGLDPEDLDSIYGSRIMVESLAVTVTAVGLRGSDLRQMGREMRLMHDHADDDRPEQWWVAHREFHRIPVQGIGSHLLRLIDSLGHQSERYIRQAQLNVRGRWVEADREHQEIHAALSTGDGDGAAELLAAHLARTALGVLAEAAPDYQPVATRTALRVVSRRSCLHQGPAADGPRA